MFTNGWCDESDANVIISDLIVTCFAISDIIAVVINSDSPEGHLPSDFFSNCHDRNATSQMLLVSLTARRT